MSDACTGKLHFFREDHEVCCCSRLMRSPGTKTFNTSAFLRPLFVEEA